MMKSSQSWLQHGGAWPKHLIQPTEYYPVGAKVAGEMGQALCADPPILPHQSGWLSVILHNITTSIITSITA